MFSLVFYFICVYIIRHFFYYQQYVLSMVALPIMLNAVKQVFQIENIVCVWINFVLYFGICILCIIIKLGKGKRFVLRDNSPITILSFHLLMFFYYVPQKKESLKFQSDMRMNIPKHNEVSYWLKMFVELLLNQAKSFINWWMNEDKLNKSV